MVARLDVGHALTNRLDDTSTLVSQNDGKGTLGIFTRKRVRVCVADTGVVDLDSDLVGLGRGDLDVLNAQLFASLPGNGGFAGNRLGKRRRVSAIFSNVRCTPACTFLTLVLPFRRWKP